MRKLVTWTKGFVAGNVLWLIVVLAAGTMDYADKNRALRRKLKSYQQDRELDLI